MLFGYTDIAAVIVLGSLLPWLLYCGVVAHRHPDRAAKIIEATGRYFPLRMRRPQWARRKRRR